MALNVRLRVSYGNHCNDEIFVHNKWLRQAIRWDRHANKDKKNKSKELSAILS